MTPPSVQAVASIDVGKRRLDDCFEPGGQTRRFANDRADLGKLAAELDCAADAAL